MIVHNRYRSENASGENWAVERDITQLRASGVEVVPYLRDSDEIADFSPAGMGGLALQPVLSPADSIAFRRLLREVAPDIVHLHNPFPLISPWIVRTAKSRRIPVVQTVHNYRHVCANGLHFRDGHLCWECVDKRFPWPAIQHGCYRHSTAESIPIALAIAAHRKTWGLVDRFLPIGEGVASHLRSIGIPSKLIEVRPNPVPDPGGSTVPGDGILFVGRLSTEKGVELLLEAWRTSGLGAVHTLTIAGDGELRSLARAAAAADPSILMRGMLASGELAAEYRRAALVVAPSLVPETDGIAVVEAMAHGRAVVAVARGEIGRHVGAAGGWLVEPRVASLAAALQLAVEDRSELVHRGELARRWFLANRASGSIALDLIYRRLLDVPRGSIAIVGPDGAGKSAIVTAIRERAAAAGVRAEVDHFRPRVIWSGPAAGGGPVTDPHVQQPRKALAAVARTGVVWVDFLLGWLGPWRSATHRGLLLLERPWLDQVVDPVRYRLPTRVVRLVEQLGWWLPRPDAAVALTGDPHVMHERKPEIGVTEVERQLQVWRRVLPDVAGRTAEVPSVDVSIERTVKQVMATTERVRSPLRRRWCQAPLFPRRIDMRMTKYPTPGAALTIYQPQRRVAKWRMHIGMTAARLGLCLPVEIPPVPVDAILDRLGVDADGLVMMRSSVARRWVVGVEQAGQLTIVIKAGPVGDTGLDNEARFLRLMAGGDGLVTVPELVYDGILGDWRLMATHAPPGRASSAAPDVDDVVDIVNRLVVGTASQSPVVHGDLAPWNLRRQSGSIVVLDWESARHERRPLWDLAHYFVQRGALVRANSPRDVARLLTDPKGPGARHLEAVGVDPSTARHLTLTYLASPVAGAALVQSYRDAVARALQ